MALIKCPECGREVSDKAPSCPNCGAPITAKKEEIRIPVYFSRPSAILMGTSITGTVMVDGSAVGSAGNGANFSVMLKPGSHNIVIESNVGGVMASKASNSASLNIPDDARRVDITLKTKPANLLGVGAGIIVDGISIERRPKEITNSASSRITVNNAQKQKNNSSLIATQEWICVKCQASNQGKAKFCCECGEPRHYEWKCGNCGEINEPKVKYCFNCGKSKETGEEVKPVLIAKEQGNVISLESIISEIENCTRGSEILAIIESRGNLDMDDERKDSLISQLQRIIKLERMYGPMKGDCIRLIKEYIIE